MTKRLSVVCCVMMTLCLAANAQMLRYDQHRELEPPDYATVKLGPFFSNLSFEQTAGFRYTRSEGTGTDFLYGNNRGVINEDGLEYPLISRLDARNYILLTKNMDLDISFSIGYAYYPMETQDDEFFFDFAEEGASASFSTQFYITKDIRGEAKDSLVYRTDYIDLRGIEDNYGGQAYEHLENAFTLSADWLMSIGQSIGASIARTDLFVMSEEFESEERTTLSEAVYYEKQMSAFLVLGASATLNQREYSVDERPESSAAGCSVYADVRLTERTTASGSLGYGIGNSDELSEASTDSPSASFSLDTQMTRDLSHGIALDYGLIGGFSSPFQLSSVLSYALDYELERSSLAFASSYSSIDPLVNDLTEYSDWLTSLSVEIPITRFIGLVSAATYSARDNGDISPPSGTGERDTHVEGTKGI